MHFWTVFGAWWVAFGLLNAPIWGLHFRSWKGAAYGFSTGIGATRFVSTVGMALIKD